LLLSALYLRAECEIKFLGEANAKLSSHDKRSYALAICILLLPFFSFESIGFMLSSFLFLQCTILSAHWTTFSGQPGDWMGMSVYCSKSRLLYSVKGALLMATS